MSKQSKKKVDHQNQKVMANPQYIRLLPEKNVHDGKPKSRSAKRDTSKTEKKVVSSKQSTRPQSEVSWVTKKNRARKFQRDINSPSGFCYSAITSHSEGIYPIGALYPDTEGEAPSVTFTYRDILRHLYKVWEPQLCRNYRPTVEYSKERDVLYKPDKTNKQPKGRRKLKAAKAALDLMNSFYAGSYYNPLIYAGQNTLEVPTAIH